MMIKRTTKDLLAESLKELCKTKSADKITIRELTQNCGLTAPTFYNHFRDKYELMAWIYNCEVEKTIAQLNEGVPFEEVVYRWIKILIDDEKFYRNLLKNVVGQNSFRYATNDHAINLMRAWLQERHEVSDDVNNCLRFYMRAISETINDWFLNRCEYPPRVLAKLLVEWMPAPLKPFLLQI